MATIIVPLFISRPQQEMLYLYYDEFCKIFQVGILNFIKIDFIMKKIVLFSVVLLLVCNSYKTQTNLIWARSIAEFAGDSKAIAVDASNNVFTTGEFYSGGDFDPGPGTFDLTPVVNSSDIFISKLDASGNFAWAKAIGGTGNDYSYSIITDAAGGVYIAGTYSGTVDFDPGAGVYNLTSNGIDDAFILKLDNSGNLVWAKSIGGANDDAARSITFDNSGNIYATGFFFGTADFDPGVGVNNVSSSGIQDAFIVKLDALGNFVWIKHFGATNSYVDGRSLKIDGSGNIFTTGAFTNIVDFDPGVGTYTLGAVNSNDIFVSKLDPSGNFVWAKGFGGTFVDIGNSLALDASGNVYSTGYFNNTVDFDPGAGTYTLFAGSGGSSSFISKLDAAGNFMWVKQMGERGYCITTDPAGNIYNTGYFSVSSDFDPGPGTYILNSAGSTDIFICKLNGSGGFVWAAGFGDFATDEGFGITIDASSNLYTTGAFLGSVDFDPGPSSSILNSNNGAVYIAKYNNIVGISEQKKTETIINIYPNPNNGLFEIRMNTEINNGKLTLINSLGQKVHEQSINKGTHTISAELPVGLYTYILQQNGETISAGKLIIE
jgi:hypothetical protein